MKVKARRKRPYKQRLVLTVMPADSVFRFQARVCVEGRLGHASLRVTIPRPVVRGLEHLGWSGVTPLNARVNAGVLFTARARQPNEMQCVISLPKEHRGELAAGDVAQLELSMPPR